MAGASQSLIQIRFLQKDFFERQLAEQISGATQATAIGETRPVGAGNSSDTAQVGSVQRNRAIKGTFSSLWRQGGAKNNLSQRAQKNTQTIALKSFIMTIDS